jgi:hypothetical protein
MVATLLRLVGIDLKRLARETAITIVLAMLGVFAALLRHGPIAHGLPLSAEEPTCGRPD